MNDNTINPLHIIATGAATAVGSYAAATLAAVQAGISNITEHPYLLDKQGEPHAVSMAPYLDPELQGTARFNALLNYALSDAGTDLGLPATTPLVLCLPHEHFPFGKDQARNIAQQLVSDCVGLRMTFDDVIQQGHAAAFFALANVQQHLERHDFCILLAVDSMVDSHRLDWLDSQQAIYSEENPYGFTPGEAAACVVLCTQPTLEKYALESLGGIAAFANAHESVHHTQGVCIGQGLSAAIGQVLKQCPALSEQQQRQKIDHTICDINGQPHRSDEYGFTLTRYSDYFEDPNHFTAPADCWGDVGAASSVLQMVLATAPPTNNVRHENPTLLWASSLNGLRGAALFQPMNTDA